MTFKLHFGGLCAFAMALCLLCSPAAFSNTWMSAGDLTLTFSGKTIAGVYPSGRVFVETYHVGGRVKYHDQVRQVGGRWRVSQGSFCTIYDGDGTGGCYSVRRTGENCFEFYFISRDENQSDGPGDPSWTAQAWITDKPSTCVAGSEV